MLIESLSVTAVDRSVAQGADQEGVSTCTTTDAARPAKHIRRHRWSQHQHPCPPDGDITRLQELNRIIPTELVLITPVLKEILKDHLVSTSTGGNRSTSNCGPDK